MKHFDIQPIKKTLAKAIQEKIDNLNKPKGALGRLEEIAMQVCLIQESLTPSLAHPSHLLLGGDHGIEREGVSVSPREVTWQQMKNFTLGGGGVNMFCRQHGFKLRIVDVGVDYDLSDVEGIIDRKIARGTKNFLYEPAMSEAEFDQTIAVGSDLVLAIEYLDVALWGYPPGRLYWRRRRTRQTRHPTQVRGAVEGSKPLQRHRAAAYAHHPTPLFRRLRDDCSHRRDAPCR